MNHPRLGILSQRQIIDKAEYAAGKGDVQISIRFFPHVTTDELNGAAGPGYDNLDAWGDLRLREIFSIVFQLLSADFSYLVKR